MPKQPSRKKGIDSFSHDDDKRTNIPTSETQELLTDKDRDLKPVFYQRNKDLDPQLMWRGKDEENEKDLMADAPPIYIQEKIEPKALIMALDHQTPDGNNEMQLFENFNGLDLEEALDFYEHDVNWSNRLILGDSLQVMSSLAEREGYRGQVKMIYMDPPYGIKFDSNWQVTTNNAGGGKTSRQPEQIKAFRDTWKLGIHSYLSYLRDRLMVCRDLLMDSGSIFVQIGEENVHLVRSLLDEVFGRDNFVRQIQYRTTMAQQGDILTRVCDYVLWYAKANEDLSAYSLWVRKNKEQIKAFNNIEMKNGTRRPMAKVVLDSGVIPKGSRRYSNRWSLQRKGTDGNTMEQPFEFQGKVYKLSLNTMWCVKYPEGLERLKAAKRIDVVNDELRYIRYLDEMEHNRIDNLWNDMKVGTPRDGNQKKKYIVETSSKAVERCILMSTKPGDLVLDPTSGGGTTASAAEKFGRRWITIDSSRVAISLSRERIMSNHYKHFILKKQDSGSNSIEGKVREQDKNSPSSGFEYHTEKRVGMESISKNESIVPGLSCKELRVAVEEGSRKIELYDKPIADPLKVRVSGRFTVESLSPFRYKNPSGTPRQQMAPSDSDFTALILENLKKSGVQNTIRGERIKFDTISDHANGYIQATGTYKDGSGKEMNAAISIGPQFGTVGKEHINEAAKEAIKGKQYDILLICAFAFEAAIDEHTKEFGSLKIMNVRINTDLMMGERLKPDANANLFTVFGEPDIEVCQVEDERWEEAYQVRLRGVDIYDPNTGQVRSTNPNELACWFIDTEYNEEAFFVRHAYFTGDEENYKQLAKALKAEINEDAWQVLYRTESQPFPRPEKGKIAVKVINHHGDEVLKVYDLSRPAEEKNDPNPMR